MTGCQLQCQVVCGWRGDVEFHQTWTAAAAAADDDDGMTAFVVSVAENQLEVAYTVIVTESSSAPQLRSDQITSDNIRSAKSPFQPIQHVVVHCQRDGGGGYASAHSQRPRAVQLTPIDSFHN